MNKQKGFSLVEGLLIVLILCVVGFAGYTVWNDNQDDDSEQTDTVQQESTQQSVEQPSDPSEEAPSIPEGWVKYENEELGISFNHTSEWGNIIEKDFDGGIIKVEIARRVQKSFDTRGGGRGGGGRGRNI